MDILELIVALPIILAGAELFTNGVEWVGEGFGLSEGAVGSVLAAIGTALPETVLPLVAIILGHHGVGDEVGIGAILGSPLMLSTLAVAILGFTVVVSKRRSAEITVTSSVVTQDLVTFLGLFALAVIAGVIHVRPLHYALSPVMLIAYGFYVRRHFRSPGEASVEKEATGSVRPLYLRRWAGALSIIGGWPVSCCASSGCRRARSKATSKTSTASFSANLSANRRWTGLSCSRTSRSMIPMERRGKISARCSCRTTSCSGWQNVFLNFFPEFPSIPRGATQWTNWNAASKAARS